MSLSKEISLTLCNSRSLNLFEHKAFFFFLKSDLLAAHGTAKNNKFVLITELMVCFDIWQVLGFFLCVWFYILA